MHKAKVAQRIQIAVGFGIQQSIFDTQKRVKWTDTQDQGRRVEIPGKKETAAFCPARLSGHK